MNISQLVSIIQTSRNIDPTLSDILIALAQEQLRVSTIVDPAPIVESKVSKPRFPPAPNVLNFTVRFTLDNVILEWEAPSFDVFLYEIRVGSSWDSASRILTTATLQAILDPIYTGTTTYLIKVIDSNGSYSADAASVIATVPEIPAFQVHSSILGNFVLLSWSEPVSTFRIAYYICKKDGVEFARINSTFITKQEFAGGTFTYYITAVDVAGNYSGDSFNVVKVPAPADFIIKSEFESSFSGTKVRAKSDGSSLWVDVDITETYQAHFTSRSWASPQAQVTAGYTRWLSPNPTTASYKEVFDIGVIYTNTIVNLSYLYTLISGSFTVGFSTRVSNDNISWSSADTNMSFFAASVRYIEVTINFTGSDDKALMQFYHFHVAVSVREEIDSGEVSAVSSDANGTVVTFNKAFKDVDSITVSVKTTTEHFIAVYRFTDAPNPTQFTVFAYDSSGIRVSKTVEWKVRGII